MTREISSAYKWAARIIRLPLLAVFRPIWKGGENLPSTGGFIAAANHVSELDSMTFLHYLIGHGVPARIMAKASLFKVPVLGPTLTACKMVPVHRGSSRVTDALVQAYTALEDGEVIAVCPEGTLTREPDMWPMKAKTGVARMALRTGVPVIPVAQWGAHRVLGRYRRVIKPFPRKEVTVVAGPPVDLSDLIGKEDDKDAVIEATARIMADITKQLEIIRGKSAPSKVFNSAVDYVPDKKNLAFLDRGRARLRRARKQLAAKASKLTGKD